MTKPYVFDLDILAFETPKAWHQWLKEHSSSTPGIWLRMYKKASGKPTITYAEALDEALCFGWIDGIARTYDEASYVQRFTPRRPKSLWSKRNIEHIARLTKEGRMQPNGIAEVERAKADGRWAQAYDSPANTKIPDDFLKELSKDKKAEAFFQTLNKTNLYAIAWRLQTAKKPETRANRMKKILEMLHNGEKLH